MTRMKNPFSHTLKMMMSTKRLPMLLMSISTAVNLTRSSMITIQRNKESGREPGTLSRACKAEKFQVFFCPCHRHIEDPSFLFTMLRLPGASVGKGLLITVRDPHMVEFQSLCRMYRQQSDPAVFLFFLLLLHATPYIFPALQLFPVKLCASCHSSRLRYRPASSVIKSSTSCHSVRSVFPSCAALTRRYLS